MRYGKRAAGALVAAAAMAVTSACGLGGDDEEAGDEGRLVDVINENYRLDIELTEAENRVLVKCMEDQGFTVHDQTELETWPAYEQDQFVDYYPTENFLPAAEIAEQWGFGQWAYTDEAWDSDEARKYEEQRWNEEDEVDLPETDNSAFEALSTEEQREWYVAFKGEAYAEMNVDDALEEDMELEDESGDGSIDFDDPESFGEPAPEGCLLEMIEALYGAPEQVQDNSDEIEYTYWSWRPESPENETDWDDLNLSYRDRIQDEEYEFLDCLAEAGHGDWEFGSYGELPIFNYFSEIYYGEDSGMIMYAGVDDVATPEVPADLPADFEGKREYEVALAVDFVACGDQTGFKEAADSAWEQNQLEYYLAMEQELYSWQEEMREAIGKAQELIDA